MINDKLITEYSAYVEIVVLLVLLEFETIYLSFVRH